MPGGDGDNIPAIGGKRTAMNARKQSGEQHMVAGLMSVCQQ